MYADRRQCHSLVKGNFSSPVRIGVTSVAHVSALYHECILALGNGLSYKAVAARTALLENLEQSHAIMHDS